MDKQNWKKSFIIVALGQVVSIIGSSAVQFALIWWLASETSSPMVMAWSGVVSLFPQLVLGPFAGVWIDRLKRKTVIICADMSTGIVALILAAFFYYGNPPYWSVYIVLFIRGIGGVFHTPAMQAALPMLVPTESIVKVNGWNQFIQSGAYMLGPVIGAMMYSSLTMPVILLTDIIGATVASITIAIINIPEPEKKNAQKRHFIREMKEGAIVFLNDRKLFVITLAATLSMVFFMPLSSYYPLMTSSYFKATAWHAGIVEMLYAIGMMVSAVIIGVLNIKNKFGMIHIGFIGLGITSFISGILPPTMTGFWIFAGVCCIMGGSGNFFNVPYMSHLQETVPPETMGRVFSLLGSVLSLTMPLGLIVSGPVAEKYGVPHWFLISGVAIIIISISSFVYLKFASKVK